MLAVSRDQAWLLRLERIAEEGGWPFEVRAALPAPTRTPPPERGIVVCDGALVSRDASKAVSLLRELYPEAALVVVCAAHGGELDAALASGADEVLDKSLADEKLRTRFSLLRDRALASAVRASADGRLRAERRSRRLLLREGRSWRDLDASAPDFELAWLLLAREGEPVARESALAALASTLGREPSLETLSRRLRALRAKLAPWGGELVARAQGALLRSPLSRAGGPRRRPSRRATSRPS